MDYATDVSPLVLDLETAPLENVRDYLDVPDCSDIKAPSNYVKQEAIDGYIARETAKRVADYDTDCDSKAALDFNTARIVALGYWTQAYGSCPVLALCHDEAQERVALEAFWREARHRLLIGFAIREFDLPMLIQRSRYLGVPHPAPDLGRYAKGSGILDLRDLLTFNDMKYSHLMPRTLTAFARRFRVPVTDTIAGKDIPQLVAVGDWDAVTTHCLADIDVTIALARRLGVLQPQPALTGAV